MKLVDCVLISLAASTTLLTLYVLDRGRKLEVIPRQASWYRKVVIHSPCQSVTTKPKINAHYIIDKNGIIQQTWAWEKSIPLEHTKDIEVNRMSVSVIIESTENRLVYNGLANLCKALDIGIYDVMIHNDSCPGLTFSLKELSKAFDQINR